MSVEWIKMACSKKFEDDIVCVSYSGIYFGRYTVIQYDINKYKYCTIGYEENRFYLRFANEVKSSLQNFLCKQYSPVSGITIHCRLFTKNILHIKEGKYMHKRLKQLSCTPDEMILELCEV